MKRHMQLIRDGEYSDGFYMENTLLDDPDFGLDLDEWEEDDYGDFLPQQAMHRLSKQAAKNTSRMKKVSIHEDRDDF